MRTNILRAKHKMKPNETFSEIQFQICKLPKFQSRAIKKTSKNKINRLKNINTVKR